MIIKFVLRPLTFNLKYWLVYNNSKGYMNNLEHLLEGKLKKTDALASAVDTFYKLNLTLKNLVTSTY